MQRLSSRREWPAGHARGNSGAEAAAEQGPKACRHALRASGCAVRTLAFGLAVALATVAPALAQTDYTVGSGSTQTVSTVISDGGSPAAVAVGGGGTLVLAGPNTYSGGTTISGVGTTIQVTNASGGTSSSIGIGTLTLDGGAFQGPAAGGALLTFINPIQLSSNGGTIDSNGNLLTMNGGIADANGASGGTLTLADSSGGGGILTLGGSSTYGGTTAITTAYVIAGSSAAYAPQSAFQVGIAGTLAIGGYNNTIASLADGLGGGGDVQNDGFNPATLTISGASGVSTTFSGQIRDGEFGTFALAKDGGSTQILTGANVYNGGTTVLGGTLVAANANALGSGGVAVNAGGTLNIDNVAIPNTLTLSGSGSGGFGNSGPGALSGTGTAAVNGNITLAGNTLVGVANAGDTLTLSGPIADGGNGYALLKNGAGTLVLSGANTYSGGTTICGTACGVAGGSGILQVTNSSPGTSSSIGTGLLTMDGGTLQAAGGGNLSFSNGIRATANGGTFDANATTLTLSGNITDAGSSSGGTLAFQSSAPGGTTVLRGANTYSGITAVASGTLAAGSTTAFSPNSAFQVGSGGTLDLSGESNTVGSLADGNAGGGTVTNNGAGAATLTVGGPASGTATFSGAIRDGASTLALIKAGTGTLALTGTSNYSGGTTLRSGILAVGNPSAIGGGILTFDGGSLLAGGSFTLANNIVLDTPNGLIGLNGNALTLSGGITGTNASAGLFINDNSGLGTAVLTGTSSYTGTTTIQSGTLEAGATDAFAPGSAFTVASGATLALNNYDQTIGSLAGAGSVTLGSATLSTGNDGTSTTFSGTISGSGGKLIKVGNGTLVLSGDNTYSGGTTVYSGTLSVGSSGNLGSGGLGLYSGATLAITGNGTFGNSITLAAADPSIAVSAGTTATWSGVIADGNRASAALSLTGAGTLVLTAANTYAGGTTISAGTLQIGAGGTTGSIVGNVTDNAALAFDRSDNVTFAGAISGTGTLAQQGAGTLILDGNSGGFTGATAVQTGTLEVGDASHSGAVLGGNVTVANGGTLMGHGTVNGTVTNNGNVQPGGTVGLLTVSGNYTQANTATLTIEVTPATVAGVGYDQLAVGGTASLAGGLAVLDDAGTYRVGSRYTVLTAAGGRSGTFGTVTYNPLFAAYITPDVTYDANAVYLTLEPTPAPPSAGPPALFNSGQEVPDMLTALASTAAGVAETVLGHVCDEAAQRQTSHGQGCILRNLGGGYQTEVWLRGIGGLGNLTGTAARMSFRDSYGGMLLGAGIGRDGITLGAGSGFVTTMLNFSNGSDATQTAGLGFVYGRYVHGPLWLRATAAYGAGQVDGARALPPTRLTAIGNRPGNFAIVQTRAAYDLALGALTIEPRAMLAYLHAGQRGFAETGGTLLDLTYADTHTDEALGRLTARAMRSFTIGTWGVAPWAEAGVQETFSGLPRRVLVADGAFSAGVSGISPTPTAGIIGLGVDAAATNGLDLFLRYQGLFSSNQAASAFSTGLSLRF